MEDSSEDEDLKLFNLDQKKDPAEKQKDISHREENEEINRLKALAAQKAENEIILAEKREKREMRLQEFYF